MREESLPAVVLASNSLPFFKGISVIINNEVCGRVVGNASCYREAVDKVTSLLPDVLLVDLDNHINKFNQLITTLRKSVDTTKVLMVGPYHSSKVVFDGLKAGAVGFISKNDLFSLLPSAIMHVFQGRYFLSPPITTMMVNDVKLSITSVNDPYEELTEREKEILRLISEGYGSRHIADNFNVSIKTIFNARSKIHGKLNIHNPSKLVKYAISKQTTYAS